MQVALQEEFDQAEAFRFSKDVVSTIKTTRNSDEGKIRYQAGDPIVKTTRNGLYTVRNLVEKNHNRHLSGQQTLNQVLYSTGEEFNILIKKNQKEV